MKPIAPVKTSFKQQMLKAREEAIVQTVNRLLAEKGFEAMTVDEVAAQVGIAKASLYKHFPSKEDLAAAAMVRVMNRARDFIEALPQDAAPMVNLREVVRWVLQVKLAGDMPSLPSQNSTLRADGQQRLHGRADGRERPTGWLDRGGASLGRTQPQAARHRHFVHLLRAGLRLGAGVSQDGGSV
jgi:AcrR family transcriptional regulator